MLLHQFLMPECLYKEGFLPLAQNTGGIGEPSRCWSLFLPGSEIQVWQIKMDEALKQYTAFTMGNLGFFKCDRVPFGLCNALATFQ